LIRKRVPWAEDSVIMQDGRSVVAFDNRSELLQLVDVRTEQPLLQFQTDRIHAPDFRTSGCDLALSSKDSLVAAHVMLRNKNQNDVAYDQIRVCNVRTGEQLIRIPCPRFAAFAFSPDERQFAAAADGSIRFWDTTTWKETGIIHLPKDRDVEPSAVLSLAFSPDGSRIATGHADSTILLWSTRLAPLNSR
jgi:WD40 repeat protein